MTGWQDPVRKPLKTSVFSTHDSHGIDDLDVARRDLKGFTGAKMHGHQRRE
jgi:hypothetical protein